VNRLRPGLHDKELSGPNAHPVPIFGPLDVHRFEMSRLFAVVVFNDARPFREFQDLIIFET